MNILRRKYLIYPEIQIPLMKQIAIGLFVLSSIQMLGIFLSMRWLEAVTSHDISIVVDYRVLGPWKTLLYVSIIIPMILNLVIGLFIVLFVSNRFAGPLFRLERELDMFLTGQKGKLEVKFRKDDYLHSLSEKINKLNAK